MAAQAAFERHEAAVSQSFAGFVLDSALAEMQASGVRDEQAEDRFRQLRARLASLGVRWTQLRQAPESSMTPPKKVADFFPKKSKDGDDEDMGGQ